MVGSITFVRKEGDHVKKGDEVSSFNFYQETLQENISNLILTLAAWLFFVRWKHCYMRLRKG